MTRRACVTGRFQPVHHQHLELFELALRDADELIVAITNPDPGARHVEPTSAHRHTDDANPFTYFERVQLLRAAGVEATIVPFDLTRPAVWREYVPLDTRQVVRVYSDWERAKAQRLADGGYVVDVIEGDPGARVSATDIRRWRPGWSESVPARAAALIESWR